MTVRTRVGVRSTTTVLLGALVAALLAVAPAAAQPEAPADLLQVIKDDDSPSNVELVVRLSEATPRTDVRRVAISRDDQFADALASGVLQDDSPLLMVPSDGQVPTRVLDEIRRLGAQEAVILGGNAAVSDDVEAQFQQAGLQTARRQGGSRFETAIEIARAEAPEATTAILARAGASDPNNPTQGFADALASGAMAAENGWSILLTDTNALTAATREYMSDSSIERVLIIGGTAAVSAAVEDEVRSMVGSTERIAGDSRAGTAIEIAKELGVDDAGDTDRVVLVDGTSPNGFAGGFAAAGHAAVLDAPIVLADGIMLPPETESFLSTGAAFAQAGDPVAVTCVVHPLACDGGREELGLVAFPLLDVNPPINSLVQPGQSVQVTLTPVEEGANTPVTVKGSCLDGQQDLVTDGSGRTSFVLAEAFPPFSTCSLDVTWGQEDARVQQGYSYALDPDLGRGDGVTVSSSIFSFGTEIPSTPLYVADRISCSGPAGDEAHEDATYEASYLHEDFFVETFGLTSFPLEALPGDTCTAEAQVPSGLGSSVLWGVYSWSDAGLRNPLALGRGTTATFDFDDIGSVADVSVVWILRVDTTEIGTPPSPPEGVTGQVFNPENLQITCDGVLIEPDLSFQTPGASCNVAPDASGRQILVVEPGRPLVPSTTASFTAPTSAFTTAVYTVLIDRSGAMAGGGGAAGCVDAPELPFSTITPGLTTPSAPSAYSTFFGLADEALRFRADNQYGDFELGLDPVMHLYAPDGTLLLSNDDGDSLLNSRIDAVLPEEGLYCIEVTGFGGTTGNFLLVADPAPAFSDTQVLDPVDQPVYGYEYIGTAGDPLVVEMRVPGFEATDPYLEIYHADDLTTPIASDDDGGGFPNARLELVIPADGTYVIAAGVFGDAYGPYLLEASFPTAASPAAFAAAGPGGPSITPSG